MESVTCRPKFIRIEYNFTCFDKQSFPEKIIFHIMLRLDLVPIGGVGKDNGFFHEPLIFLGEHSTWQKSIELELERLKIQQQNEQNE